jgi:NAD(P)H-nitrite reductase large subunit
MSAGGAARLLEQGVRPGERVLLAGHGAWVAAAATELRRVGLELVDVVDADDGRIVVRAEGERGVERAVIASAGSETMVEIDALVLAFGWLPENQLARLAGCQHTDGAYVSPTVVRDDWMRTGVPGVLVAGDAGGIVGAEASLEQGRLAGLAVAVAAGRLTQAEADQRAGSLRGHQGFVAGPRAGLHALADADTVICRCEDVTAGQIVERLFDGGLEPGPVIAETRAGMGSCQGRNCLSLIAATIACHFGQPIEGVPAITPRPPVVPVWVGALAERPPEFAPVTD